MRAFIYKGSDKNLSVQICSYLSENYDILSLYSLVMKALNDRELCEQLWHEHAIRLKKLK